MKKLLLSLIILTGASQLKAQQLNVKPSDPLLFKSPKDLSLEQFKLGDSTLFKDFSNLPKAQQLAALPNLGDINSNLFYSNMPVAKLSGNIDHMPIIKPEGNIDRMPVKKIKVVPLGKLQQPIP